MRNIMPRYKNINFLCIETHLKTFIRHHLDEAVILRIFVISTDGLGVVSQVSYGMCILNHTLLRKYNISFECVLQYLISEHERP